MSGWRANGGYLGPRPTGPSTSAASGWWDSRSQFRNRRDGQWPLNGDPYWANVSLLLPMNGDDASTTFTDASSNAATVTAVGNAQTSIAISKFGGSSGLFDGDADYLTVTGDLRLAGDFTVEAWVYPTTASGFKTIINIGTEASGRFLFGVTNGVLGMDRYFIATTSFTGGSVALNQWSHVAITRQGSDLRAFLGGALLQTITVSGTLGNANQILRAGGSNTANQSWLGNLSHLRITTAARYTAAFTPPTLAFPLSG